MTQTERGGPTHTHHCPRCDDHYAGFGTCDDPAELICAHCTAAAFRRLGIVPKAHRPEVRNGDNTRL
jgi:hypothetical protein